MCVVCCAVRCVQLSPQIRKVEQQQKKIKSQADQIHGLNEQLGVLQAERQQAQKKFNQQLEVGGAGWVGLGRRGPSSHSTACVHGMLQLTGLLKLLGFAYGTSVLAEHAAMSPFAPL